MKYRRFEELPVWQAGIKLATRVFLLTEDRSFRYKGDIANQIQRAALSVPNNIAEGFERGTTQDLITFLYYARGSAGEVRSILTVIEHLQYFNHLRSEISDLKSLAESISRQIRAWTDSLQNTNVQGQRYLTDRSRRSLNQKNESSEFLERIRKNNEEAILRREEERIAALRLQNAAAEPAVE